MEGRVRGIILAGTISVTSKRRTSGVLRPLVVLVALVLEGLGVLAGIMGSDDAKTSNGRSVDFFQTCKLPAPVRVTPSYLGESWLDSFCGPSTRSPSRISDLCPVELSCLRRVSSAIVLTEWGLTCFHVRSGKEIYQLRVNRDETEAESGECELSFSTCTPLKSAEAHHVQTKKQSTYSGMEICSVRGIKSGEVGFRMASIDMAGGIKMYSFRDNGAYHDLRQQFAEQTDLAVDFVEGHGFCVSPRGKEDGAP
eukprot:749892-Hanusia_phi.AAC.4